MSITLKANPNYWDYVRSIELKPDNKIVMTAGQSQRFEHEIEGEYRIQMIDETNGVLELRNVKDYIDYEYTNESLKLKDIDIEFTIDSNPKWIDITYGGDTVYHLNKKFNRILLTYKFKMDPFIAVFEDCIPDDYEPTDRSESIYYNLDDTIYRIDDVELDEGYICKYEMFGYSPVYDVLKECEKLIRSNGENGENLKDIKKFRRIYHESSLKHPNLIIRAEYSKFKKMVSFTIEHMDDDVCTVDYIFIDTK